MCILFITGMLMGTSFSLAVGTASRFTLHPVLNEVPTERRDIRQTGTFHSGKRSNSYGTSDCEPGSNIAVSFQFYDKQHIGNK
jgi:hypothetical protein